ncbi:MAG: hypothetical protein PF448_02505 [Bacteroidales bacterium]|jgi:DNA-binding beta-propeller fold protein YncE|nr:hypothetical protein [Bacteroidales bacterium]
MKQIAQFLSIRVQVLIVLLAFAQAVFAYPGEIVKSLATPGDFPTGLCFFEDELVIADRKTDKLYFINPQSGAIERHLSSPAYWPMGLAYDGNSLWCVDIKGGIPLAENYQGIAYKLDVKSGEILHRIDLPCKMPIGLTFDGEYLWVIDDASDKIIQVSTADGTTIKSFAAPSRKPQGLTFDGTYLWLSDRGTDEIYMISPETGKVLLITDAPGKYARGMAWDGSHLWNVDWLDKKIHQLVRSDEDLFRRTNEKTAEISYIHQATNFGPGKVTQLDVHFAMAENRDNQELLSEIQFSEKPTDFPTDQWGQKTAHFHMKNLKAGETHDLEMSANVKVWDVRYFIFPDKVGPLNEIPEDVNARFLSDNEKYQMTHPVIQNAVEEAVGDEDNPYWIARNIYDYLMPHLYYEMTGGWNTAPTVLDRGNGSCSEYAFVYIAMCRAAGLPARYVGSVVLRGDDVSNDDVFHRWVEVYLPNYGWIPVDPSGGDQNSPRSQADYFGHLANRFFITTQGGGGSESMAWTYNSNFHYQSEPKTHLVIEYFADWRVVE